MYIQREPVGGRRVVAGVRDSKESVKFMQVLDRGIFLRLKDMARVRGVTVQELIRVLVIPDWMRRTEEEGRRVDSRRRVRRLKTVRARSAAMAPRVRAVRKSL